MLPVDDNGVTLRQPGRRLLWAALLATIAGFLSLGAAPAAATTVPGEPDSGFRGILQFETPDPERPGRNMKVPVEGAVITAYASVDGERSEAVGETATDAEGKWEIALPSGAEYQVVLDVTTLPEGVAPVNEAADTLTLDAERGRLKAGLFRLADAEGAAAVAAASVGDAWWERALRLGVQGLEFGLIIGMCAIGLSLIFATTGLVNFAHAEMITIGAVLAWYLNSGLGLHLLIVIPIAVFIGGLLGVGLDLGVWRPLRRRGTGLVAMMIVSIGLSIALRYLVLYVFGDRSEPFEQYAVQTKNLFTLGPIEMKPKDAIIIVMSTVILLGVAAVLRYTKLGKAMRAVSDNPDLASSTGIDVNRTVTLVWFMAGTLVTLGAIFQAMAEGSLNWELGNGLLLLVFAGVTLGGLGTAYGAMVGSIILGVLANLTTLEFTPEWKQVGALAAMIALLLVRPQGLFGRRERIG